MFLMKNEILREKQIKHYDIEVLVRRPNITKGKLLLLSEKKGDTMDKLTIQTQKHLSDFLKNLPAGKLSGLNLPS
jgi:hypothetical protein